MARKLKENSAAAKLSFRIEDGVRIWTRRCLICTTVFDGFAPTASYCSVSCKGASKTEEKTCEDCGEGFSAKSVNTRWCSHCKYRQHRYSVSCLFCSKAFDSGRVDSKYCSKACKKSAYNAREALLQPKMRWCAVCRVKLETGLSPLGCCSEACAAILSCSKCRDCSVQLDSRRRVLCDSCREPRWRTLDRAELLSVYRECGAGEAARSFGISRKNLYRALQHFSIDRNLSIGAGRPGSKEFAKRAARKNELS